MKPFNLKDAKAGHPVCTRAGQDVRILCFDRKETDLPIVALVMTDDHENLHCYHADGSNPLSKSGVYNLDLRMKTVTTKGWINIYQDEGTPPSYRGYVVYTSKEEAERGVNPNKKHVATIPVEWEV